MAKDYCSTEAFQQQASIRAAIRRAGISRTDKEILRFLVGSWFGRGCRPIYPGREAAAAYAEVSIKTVSRAFSKYVALGILVPLAYAKGGAGMSTEYIFNLDRLSSSLKSRLKTETNVPVDCSKKRQKKPGQNRDKCPTVFKVSLCDQVTSIPNGSNHGVEFSNVIPLFRVVASC